MIHPSNELDPSIGPASGKVAGFVHPRSRLAERIRQEYSRRQLRLPVVSARHRLPAIRGRRARRSALAVAVCRECRFAYWQSDVRSTPSRLVKRPMNPAVQFWRWTTRWSSPWGHRGSTVRAVWQATGKPVREKGLRRRRNSASAEGPANWWPAAFPARWLEWPASRCARAADASTSIKPSAAVSCGTISTRAPTISGRNNSKAAMSNEIVVTASRTSVLARPWLAAASRTKN